MTDRFSVEALGTAMYSTSFDYKNTYLAGIRDALGQGVEIFWDPRKAMSAFANGCGGCEHAMFTDPDGFETWVSVLAEWDSQVYYVAIQIETDEWYDEPRNLLHRVLVMGRTYDRTSQDRPARLQFMAEAAWQAWETE